MLKVGDFALLEVVATEKVGAFLDWGQPKDLFLPYAEQTHPVEVGDFVFVYIYLDKSGRISSSMKLEKRVDKNVTYEAGEQVDLVIVSKTDLGFKAIINGKHIGMLYANEVFKQLRRGEETKGFIKQVRPDGKIDLILQQVGYKAKDDIAEKILELLKEKNGFLPLTEKTLPEEIYKLFGVSKKKYKMALGGLYKKRLITIEDDGIRLR